MSNLAANLRVLLALPRIMINAMNRPLNEDRYAR